MRSRFVVAIIAGFCSIFAATSAIHRASADEGHFNPPKEYYLALGDSAAFGFQLAKFQQEVSTGAYDPASFNTGYVDDFARQLRGIRPQIETINYSCVGETTTTFISGGCPYHTSSLPLHTDYPIEESQLEAALTFLATHPGKVSPITLNIGTNDEAALVTACQSQADPVTCIATELPATLAAVQRNLEIIVGALRAVSPDSEVIILQPPNPLALLLGLNSPVVIGLQAVISHVATVFDARLANAFSPFTFATLCSYTLYCTPAHDVHPSDLGYSVIAQQVWIASSYDRLQ
ncbi:MAG: SGNH/GDSL hydrolase family protein [Dehalococcoidia bacterium]